MTAPEIFSVPRRFDMATILVAMTGFALLFAGLRAMDARPEIMASLAGLFVAVAIGQAFVATAGNPRTASIIAGGLYWFVASAVMGMGITSDRLDFCYLTLAVIFGPITGYLAGTLVGGVFLVAYHLREGGFLSRRATADDDDNESPWEPEGDKSIAVENPEPSPEPKMT
jgi:hypothetical protein